MTQTNKEERYKSVVGHLSLATRTSSGHWDTPTNADRVDFGGNNQAYNPSCDWNLGEAHIGPLGLDNLSESTMNHPMILAIKIEVALGLQISKLAVGRD